MRRAPDVGPGNVSLRLGAIGLIIAFVLATRTLAPDPGARRESLLLLALGLGYGHQLCAWCFASRRRRTPLARLARGLTLVSAGLAFGLALATHAAFVLVLLLAALAAWHVIENDLASARSSALGLRLPPLPRRPISHLSTGLVAGLALAVVLVAPRLAPGLVAAGVPPAFAAWSPEELIAVLLLYHTAVWWGASLRVLGRGPRGRSRVAAVVAAHLAPLPVLVAASSFAPAAYAWLASPALYLFLSAWHAVHTSVERGLEPA